MSILGQAIKDARIKAGLTQKELAEKLGYKQKNSIAHIEAGRNVLSIPTLVNLAKLLNTSFVINSKSLDDTPPPIKPKSDERI